MFRSVLFKLPKNAFATANYYEVLGVKPTANYEEIQDAFVKLAKQYNFQIGKRIPNSVS